MALRIRRGPTADRTTVTFLEGELIYDTDQKAVYIGDGVAAGGLPVTSFTAEDAQDAAAAMFLNGTHANIAFNYNDTSNSIDATVTLDGGLLNIVEDLTPQLGGNLDLNSFKITGAGNIETTGDVTIIGDVSATEFSGPLVGDVSGDLTGTVLTAAQPNITSVGTLTSLAVTGSITGADFTGNVVTSSITTTSGDLTVAPNTDFSNGIDVTGAATLEDTTIDGLTTINTVVVSPLTVNIDDSATPGGRPVGLLINGQAQDLNFSGSAIEFRVNDGSTEEELVKLEAFSQSSTGDLPGLSVVVYNSGTAAYDTTPLSIDGSGILVTGLIGINDNLFIAERAAPTTSVGDSGDFAGLVVIADDYIYRCVADYDAGNPTADIWVRMAFDATPW